MSERVLINLCRNPVLVTDFISNKLVANSSVVDLTGVVSGSNYLVVKLGEIDKDGTLEARAINNYIDFIGDLSVAQWGKNNIRQYKILGLPIFWYTPIAEKHDSFHWGKDIWLLKTIIDQRSDLFRSVDCVLLPGSFSGLSRLISSLFTAANLAVPKLVFLGQNACNTSFRKVLFSSCKELCKQFVFCIKFKRKGSSKAASNASNIFVSPISSSRRELNSDIGDLSSAYKLCTSVAESEVLPYFLDTNYSEFSWDKLNTSFLHYRPTLTQIFGLFFEKLVLLIRLSLTRKNNLELAGMPLSNSIIRTELFSALKGPGFFNYLWFLNYFDNCSDGTNVFYSDEFYGTGRIVSSSVRNSQTKLNSFGVQHGLFFEGHTVYRFSPKELHSLIRKNDDLPRPDKFIVWGDFFKNLFLTKNTFSDSSLIVAGNPKYIEFSTAHSTLLASDVVVKGKPKILWCTTLLHTATQEYDIIKKALIESSNYELTIRLHPVGHISMDDIMNLLDPAIGSRVNFSSESNIIRDILKHDILLSGASSTTFLDGLFAGKKTCRIIVGGYKPAFSQHQIENLLDISNSDDFSALLKDTSAVLKFENSIGIDTICFSKPDIWEGIFNKG